MVVEESFSVVDLCIGICNGSIEVLSPLSSFSCSSKSNCFLQLWLVKQLGLFQQCNVAAKLGKVAAFGTYLPFMVEQPRNCGMAVRLGRN